MRNLLRLLVIAGFSLLTEVAALAGPPTLPGQLVLKLQPGQSAAALENALLALGARGLHQKFPHTLAPSTEQPGSVDLRGIYQVEIPTTISLAKARTMLLSTGAVAYVEPLYVREPLYQPNDPLADSTNTSLSTGQYYLKQIHAYRAWDITRGDTSIVIGITDGGVRLTHQDLAPQIKHNYADPINGVDDDGDGYVDNFTGWDLANNDNDAGYDVTIVHGSLVAGVAAARVGNGVGLAGLGNQCKFLPLNIYSNTATGSFAGYEAIVYAADHGCKVVVMAWGAVGGYSQFEQDVCTYAAVNRNAVLVAAAGNTNANLRFYPASYDHVISVSGVDNTDLKAPNATYSRRIDLVAPGISILTTYGYHAANGGGPADADYVAVGGTSFAAPLVAAAAALVRKQFPSYNADQVAAQLRQTADDISTVPGNAAYAGLLGTGRLNAARAVGITDRREARVMNSAFSPARTAYAPGETVQLRASVQNLLQPLAGLTVTLTSLSPLVTVTQGSFAIGNLATLGTATNSTTPFQLSIAATGVPLNTTATLRYRLTAANGYQTDQFVDLLLNADYVNIDAGDLHLSLLSRGNLGYDDLTMSLGEGINYRGSTPLSSEGGLLLATSPTRVSDRIRTTGNASRQSFVRLVQISRQAPGPRADQEARTVFQDSLPSTTPRIRSVGVRVRQRAYAWANTARKDFVLLEYSLKNMTADTLKPLCAGLFMDWDLPSDAARNVATWDSTRNLGYVYDPGTMRIYTGIRLLRGGPPAVYSLNNNAPAGSTVRLADGFSPAEKFLTLNSGTNRPQRTAGLPSGADVSQVVGTRVARLAPGDSVVVTFAVLAARTLPALQAAADAAQSAYTVLLPTHESATATSFQAYPNPTTGLLQVAFSQKFGLTEVRLLNMLGQVVLRQPASGSSAKLNLAGFVPGIYTLQASGLSNTATQIIVIQ